MEASAVPSEALAYLPAAPSLLSGSKYAESNDFVKESDAFEKQKGSGRRALPQRQCQAWKESGD